MDIPLKVEEENSTSISNTFSTSSLEIPLTVKEKEENISSKSNTFSTSSSTILIPTSTLYETSFNPNTKIFEISSESTETITEINTIFITNLSQIKKSNNYNVFLILPNVLAGLFIIWVIFIVSMYLFKTYKLKKYININNTNDIEMNDLKWVYE